jgi:hypothetical protein
MLQNINIRKPIIQWETSLTNIFVTRIRVLNNIHTPLKNILFDGVAMNILDEIVEKEVWANEDR